MTNTGTLRVVHLDSPVGRLRATADDEALHTLTFDEAETRAANAARTYAETDGAVEGTNAILDRLVHNAHTIHLKGESMRKKKANLT